MVDLYIVHPPSLRAILGGKCISQKLGTYSTYSGLKTVLCARWKIRGCHLLFCQVCLERWPSTSPVKIYRNASEIQQAWF